MSPTLIPRVFKASPTGPPSARWNWEAQRAAFDFASPPCPGPKYKTTHSAGPPRPGIRYWAPRMEDDAVSAVQPEGEVHVSACFAGTEGGAGDLPVGGWPGGTGRGCGSPAATPPTRPPLPPPRTTH